MKVLIACEFSGLVRESFKAKGHDAWSCDLLPTEIPGQHIQGDVLSILSDGWDLMVCHPPCTHLASSVLKSVNPIKLYSRGNLGMEKPRLHVYGLKIFHY